jgi:hypothetical protein
MFDANNTLPRFAMAILSEHNSFPPKQWLHSFELTGELVWVPWEDPWIVGKEREKAA